MASRAGTTVQDGKILTASEQSHPTIAGYPQAGTPELGELTSNTVAAASLAFWDSEHRPICACPVEEH